MNMADWLFNLPVLVMALVIFLGTYLVGALICLIVIGLAVGERGRAFKALTPGLLPPLGIIFGLLVGFMAAQVWSDYERAKFAVASEASALRSVVLLAPSFPGEPEARLRTLVNRHIEEAVSREWPAMARHGLSLKDHAAHLSEALKVTLALQLADDNQRTAQREIVTGLERALDARRQRIILSRSTITPVKWTALLLQGLCTLIAIAMVHCDNRLTCNIGVTLFATGIALSILLLAAYGRPFSGDAAVPPDLLEQVIESEAKAGWRMMILGAIASQYPSC
jgi:hypothetical protein